jgi:hypothetical protein
MKHSTELLSVEGDEDFNVDLVHDNDNEEEMDV